MNNIVSFYDALYLPGNRLIYSVIAARYRGRWIFVRHQDRDTWEIAGGHIEPGETAEEAASRELAEETGALLFDLVCVATYSVENEKGIGYGRLFFAEVESIGPVPDTSEIAEIKLLRRLPENLTYPDIQNELFRRVIEHLRGKG